MSNLENLVEKILADAKENASIVINEANKAKEEIIASREKEANENKKRIIDKAIRDSNLAKERIISGAELKVRNEKLKTKQNLIEKVFNVANERLENLDDDKYLSFLTNTLNSLDLTGEEVLVVPEKIKSKAKKLKLRSKVSEDETVESGFLIKDKGIILNYTFGSLVEHYRDELEAEIAKKLFKE